MKTKLLVVFLVTSVSIILSSLSLAIFACDANPKCTVDDSIGYMTTGEASGHLVYCTKCGYAQGDRVEPHNFEYWQNQSEHREICEDCGYSTSPEPHFLEWQTNTLSHWQSCSDCGYIGSRSRHTYSNIFGHADGGHVYICTECEYQEYEAHIWGSDDICDVCKADRMPIIPKGDIVPIVK